MQYDEEEGCIKGSFVRSDQSGVGQALKSGLGLGLKLGVP